MTKTATRKLDLRTLKLEKGAHAPDGKFCVMEAAAYIAGEDWSDNPKCVSPVIGGFLRSWNDSLDDKTRQKLKPYIRKVIGTNTGPADDEVRAWLATDWLVRTFTPTWLRKAGLNDEAASLEALPELTSTELVNAAIPTIRAAQKKARAAGAAAWDAAWDAAGAAAWAAAGAAAGAAAWDAARDAAGDAARDAAWDAARDAAWAAAGDAAGDAAWAALADTVTELQASAFLLLDRMIAALPPTQTKDETK